MKDILRKVILTPHGRGGIEPWFTLITWDTNRKDHLGKWVLGYRLTLHEWNRKACVVFDSEDFACSPLHAVDSDATIEAIMSFLCLRKGDTDKEYFDSYSLFQLDFSETYAETLGIYCWERFSEEGKKQRAKELKERKLRCTECDENVPHQRAPGQRKATCDACGYDSHWMRATYYHRQDATEDNPETGYASFDDGEYGSETSIDGTGLRYGQVFRLSCCCLSPARADLKRKRVKK